MRVATARLYFHNWWVAFHSSLIPVERFLMGASGSGSDPKCTVRWFQYYVYNLNY